MSAAHTPGPWAVSYSVDGMTVDTAKPVRFNLTTAGTAVVCRVFPHDDAEHFNGEANARLIAAAPDLLEALHAADQTFAQNGLLACHAARQQISAAILKATGGEA